MMFWKMIPNRKLSLHQSRKNACLLLWKRTRFTVSITMRLCFCWKRDFAFLNFAGLTTHIDMQNRILNIDHQLLKDSEIGYYIETPKTKNGKRQLPLTERAYQAIQRILKNREKAQPLIVGGYSNFLFLNREGLPKVAGNYEGMVRGLIKKYNSITRISYRTSHHIHSDILIVRIWQTKE